MIEEYTEEEIRLITELQQAYAALGTATSGPAADRYYQALSAWISHRGAAASQFLRNIQEYWDRTYGYGDGTDVQPAAQPAPQPRPEPRPQPKPEPTSGQLTLI
jgi:alkanesulfonate monooxygenase SsuD/methylene tetrahydromethanopterin reductase-like flavin-dependent oxidoreductase (luciferase family)